jgi:hypothetical protein
MEIATNFSKNIQTSPANSQVLVTIQKQAL